MRLSPQRISGAIAAFDWSNFKQVGLGFQPPITEPHWECLFKILWWNEFTGMASI